MELSQSEVDALSQLDGHPGWVVLKRLLTNKYDVLVSELTTNPSLAEADVLERYRHLNAVNELRYDIIQWVDEAAKNRFPHSVD